MEIQYINAKEWGIDPLGFQLYVDRLMDYVGEVDGFLNVIFVNNVYIQSLNKRYRSKDQPTDVLSFSYLDSPDFEYTHLIGEIYISIDTAKEQAREFKHDLLTELNKLFVHGFLHIFGYDHEEEEDYHEMLAIENNVLK